MILTFDSQILDSSTLHHHCFNFQIIIHFKKFDLLTHPVCELFLHLKWLRARRLYWATIVLYMVYSALVVAYVMLNYGQLGWYFDPEEGYDCQGGGEKEENNGTVAATNL